MNIQALSLFSDVIWSIPAVYMCKFVLILNTAATSNAVYIQIDMYIYIYHLYVSCPCAFQDSYLDWTNISSHTNISKQ